MNKCISLAVVHTICGAIYGSGTLVATRETSLLVLFFALPISLSMTIFYIWSLNALDNTIEHLVSRRQTVKLAMYKNLQRILAFSGFLLTSILVVNSVNMSHRNEDAWIQEQWQWRWMILDGTLNIAYLVIFASIVYLWRPTSNNERYGLEQLASDDPDEEGAIGGATDTDGIRLRTLHGDGDEDDEEAETAEDILKWAEAHVMKNPFE